MSVFQALVLGAVQGLTEFLPISSSAHLILIPWLLGWEAPPLAFDVALHLGTLAAVVGYFWRDLWGMALAVLRGAAGLAQGDRAAGRDPQVRLAGLIVLATIPAVIAGQLLNDTIDAFFHVDDAGQRRMSALLIALTLSLLGLALWLAERYARHARGLETLTWRDSLAIGFAQALALVPGVSRSGSTLTAGLALGLTRESAARFSFLLSVPIVTGALALKLLDAYQEGLLAQEGQAFAAGILASAVVGYAAIHFLLRFLRRESAAVFAYYRWGLAVVLVVMALLRG